MLDHPRIISAGRRTSLGTLKSSVDTLMHLPWDSWIWVSRKEIALVSSWATTGGVNDTGGLPTIAELYLYSAYACLQWACARIGAILVTLNPAYSLNELVRFDVRMNTVPCSKLLVII